MFLLVSVVVVKVSQSTHARFEKGHDGEETRKRKKGANLKAINQRRITRSHEVILETFFV